MKLIHESRRYTLIPMSTFDQQLVKIWDSLIEQLSDQVGSQPYDQAWYQISFQVENKAKVRVFDGIVVCKL
jgi:hypothetical protein